jgi:DICT domain-containing protein
MAGAELTIREIARQTGVPEGTLRMWESRYGFPVPERLPSGHRRYHEEEIERVRQVQRDRETGMSMRAAVERARHFVAEPDRSIFAGLRRRRPDLQPYLLAKRTLIGLSHAIEDECAVRAERPVLFASFQRARFYRAAEARWRELARTAEAAVVFADFPELRTPADAPAELPLAREEPLNREWSLICDAPEYTAFLAGWERPGQDETPDLERRFETVWSVEPELVRTAAQIAARFVERVRPDLMGPIAERFEHTPPISADELRGVGALTNRMVAYIGAGEISRPPAQRPS